MSTPGEVLSTSDVARLLDVTPDAVRKMTREGRLAESLRTPRGQRLYRRADVERYVRNRAKNGQGKRGPKPKRSKGEAKA